MRGGMRGALCGLPPSRFGLKLPRSLSVLASSAWHGTEPLPADPILGLVAAFKEDSAAQKVNLAQGAYRTDAGTPFVLASVMEAERRVAADLRSGLSDKEYLPIEGHASFRRLSAELVLGEGSPSLREGRVVRRAFASPPSPTSPASLRPLHALSAPSAPRWPPPPPLRPGPARPARHRRRRCRPSLARARSAWPPPRCAA